jgi:hypothetical protein
MEPEERVGIARHDLAIRPPLEIELLPALGQRGE